MDSAELPFIQEIRESFSISDNFNCSQPFKAFFQVSRVRNLKMVLKHRDNNLYLMDTYTNKVLKITSLSFIRNVFLDSRINPIAINIIPVISFIMVRKLYLSS